MNQIFLASDHAGLEAKNHLVSYLQRKLKGDEIVDLGTHSQESCHYPEFAIDLVKHVKRNASRGILVCGSGIGMSIVANRFSGIRAALCRSEEEARLSRLHNDANVLCLGGRITPLDQLERITSIWLESPFEGVRHMERIKIFNQLGEK